MLAKSGGPQKPKKLKQDRETSSVILKTNIRS